MNTTATEVPRLIQVRSLLLGRQLDLKALRQAETMAAHPLTLQVGEHGLAILFRFGIAVLFDVTEQEQAALIERLLPMLETPLARPGIDSLAIAVDPGYADGFANGHLQLHEAGVARLQLVAEILAANAVLDEYETSIAATFDRIEPLAARMKERGAAPRRARHLAQYIGEILLGLHRMVGRAEVGEKPELLWEYPELEPLYQRLEREYEIRDRRRALERKLDLISRTASTLLELLEAKRTLHVEWYIVILIVVEILLTLYELFIHVQ